MNISSSIENKIFFSKYKPDTKIGEGSFGKIYSAHNINNGELFALKLEKRNGTHSLLEIETYILCYLKGEGIPFIKSYGFSGEYNVLVMELLGKSLEILFKENNFKFSLKTVCMLAEQMITRLEYIHKKYILHRDIKPDNFTLGRGKKSHIIYLIDFGLSKKYKSSRGDHEHIKYSENKKLIGTARYASINALKGCEQGRRDDMESLGYVLMYFLRGNLPWQGLKLYKGDDRYKRIYEVKKNTSAEELCAGYPRQLCEYIRYTRNLTFEQEPNYDYLKQLIYDIMNKYEYNLDFLFDWGINKNKTKLAKKIINDNYDINKTNDNYLTTNDIIENKIINNTEKKEIEVNNKNNKIKVNKRFQIKNIYNHNYKIVAKKSFKNSNSKLNKDFNRNNLKKREFNKIKYSLNEKGKIQKFNSIKNKREKMRYSEKISKNKSIFKNNDNIIFDKLLKSQANTQDRFYNNQSQDMNLRINHYKFISELNSSSKKEEKLKIRNKGINPIDYNKIIKEDDKDDGCFIF